MTKTFTIVAADARSQQVEVDVQTGVRNIKRITYLAIGGGQVRAFWKAKRSTNDRKPVQMSRDLSANSPIAKIIYSALEAGA